MEQVKAIIAQFDEGCISESEALCAIAATAADSWGRLQ